MSFRILNFYQRLKQATLCRDAPVNGFVPCVQSKNGPRDHRLRKTAIELNLVIANSNSKSTGFMTPDRAAIFGHSQSIPVCWQIDAFWMPVQC